MRRFSHFSLLASGFWLLCFALSAHAQPFDLMTGLGSNVDWATGQTWVNLKNLLRAPGSVASPWDESIPPSAYNAFGYPVVDFGLFANLHDYPKGTYTIDHGGDGQIVPGLGCSNYTGSTIDIDGDSGAFSITVRGVNAANPFRDLRIIPVGYNPAEVFTPKFKALLKPFASFRWMDGTRTNETPVAWASRPTPGGFQTVKSRGVAWEYVIALANETHKDVWVNVPHTYSTERDVPELAALFAKLLDPSLKVLVEYSNEPWNDVFPQKAAILAEAKARAAELQLASDRVAPTDLELIYRLVALKQKQVGAAFRSALGANRVKVVLAGQAVNTWPAERACFFADASLGGARAVFDVASYADYLYPEPVAERGNPGVDTLFVATQVNVNVENAKWIAAWRGLADQYGVREVRTYEGGIDLVNNRTGNAAQHLAMQTDPRMGTLYKNAITQFFKAGGTSWGHYYLVGSWGDPGKEGTFGFYGALPDAKHPTPKYDALVLLGGAAQSAAVPIPANAWPASSKPAVPIGAWNVPVRDMDRWIARGVNVFVGCGLEVADTPAARMAWAKGAEDRKAWVVFDPQGQRPANLYAVLMPDEVDAKQADPAVAKWDGLRRDQLRPMYDAFKRSYPDVPVFQSLAGDHVTQGGRLNYYTGIADCSDVWSEDWYPFTRNATRYSNDLKVQAVLNLRAAAPTKPVWSFVETSHQLLENTPLGRQITPAELADAVARTRAAGAIGTAYFSHVFNGKGGWVAFDGTPADVAAAITAVDQGLLGVTQPPATQPTTKPATQPTTAPVKSADVVALEGRVTELKALVAGQQSWIDGVRRAATQPSGGN